MSGQYDPNRKVTRTKAIERVSQFDQTVSLDLGRQKKFEAALGRAADESRRKLQLQKHTTFADAEARQAAPKPKKP